MRFCAPGGEVHIAGYGQQRTNPMRARFRFVQVLDGYETTTPNAQALMHQAGVKDARETLWYRSPRVRSRCTRGDIASNRPHLIRAMPYFAANNGR